VSTSVDSFVLLDQWSINIDSCYPMLRIVELPNGDIALHIINPTDWIWTPVDSREFASHLADRIDFIRGICYFADHPEINFKTLTESQKRKVDRDMGRR
jgi:hypothetical protein